MEMADDPFPVEVCGGANWYRNSPTNLFGSSPSSITELTNFGWPSSYLPSMNVNSSAATAGSSFDDSAGSTSDGSSVQHAAAVSDSMMMTTESAFPTLGFFGNSTDLWNHQNLLYSHYGGRRDENYSQIQQENASQLNPISINYRNQTTDPRKVESDWDNDFCLDSYTNSSFRPAVNRIHFPNNSFNLDTSSMSQNLFGQVLDRHDHERNYFFLASTEHDSSHDHQFLSCLNAQSNIIPSQFLPSTVNDARNNISNVVLQKKNKFQPRGDARDKVTAAKKSSLNEKRRRMETPSPLPTSFKVRKEKLGDRITALQQLVSPFGKTDTASVLHEAIDYIKFLHDQVQALTTPYLKPRQRQQVTYNSHDKKLKDEGGRGKLRGGLSGRGLCLVPISITFPVAAETTSGSGHHLLISQLEASGIDVKLVVARNH